MKRTALVVTLLVAAVSLLYAHDLFIKFDSYFLSPNSSVRVPILNGTFTVSSNSVAADRMKDISLIGPGGREQIDATSWDASSDTTTTYLTLSVGEPGTYVVGASVRRNQIDLKATDFNEYLEHGGIPDVLEARKRDNALDRDVTERYAKHVKAVFQVGDARTDGYKTVVGYPAEIVPLENPYALTVGVELRVRCLVDGQPVENQLVIAGGENDYGVIAERSARTNPYGVATFVLDKPGTWYVKFINMARLDEPDADYESKWATLTFAIR